MKKINILTLSSVLLFSILINTAHAQGIGCAAGYDCNERGVGIPGDEECGNGAWESLLISQESGDNYNVQYSAKGALGRYQFINGTRQNIGNANSLPCAGNGGQQGREGFRSCPGLQDEYFRALTSSNVSELSSTCDQYCDAVHECPVTMSGLAAIAHNVGPACARAFARGGHAEMEAQPPLSDTGQSVGCTDANGTNAAEKYGCAMGGYDMAGYNGVESGCGFGFTPGPPSAPYQGHLLGCDPAVLEKNQAIVDASTERDMQVAKSMITQPPSIEQMTCTDQHIQMQSATGGVLSNLPGGNISETMGPLVERKFIKDLTANFMEANPLGSLQSMISNSYAKVTQDFNTMMSGLSGGLLGGLGGGADASGGCNMMNESWLLSQCIQMPRFPSVNDILNGAMNEVTGAVVDLINSPLKALDQVCQGMSDKLGGFSSDAGRIFEDAASGATSPITDSVNQATDNITGIGN